MEGNAGMRTDAFLASAQSPKILGRFRDNVTVKLHHYPSFQLSPNAYVQVTSRIPHLSLTGKKLVRHAFSFSFASLLCCYLVAVVVVVVY